MADATDRYASSCLDVKQRIVDVVKLPPVFTSSRPCLRRRHRFLPHVFSDRYLRSMSLLEGRWKALYKVRKGHEMPVSDAPSYLLATRAIRSPFKAGDSHSQQLQCIPEILVFQVVYFMYASHQVQVLSGDRATQKTPGRCSIPAKAYKEPWKCGTEHHTSVLYRCLRTAARTKKKLCLFSVLRPVIIIAPHAIRRVVSHAMRNPNDRQRHAFHPSIHPHQIPQRQTKKQC